MNYRERLKSLREDNDYTQTEIGKLIHKSQQGYNHIETGRAELKIEDLAVLCKFYKVSADYIIGLTDDIKQLKTVQFGDSPQIAPFFNRADAGIRPYSTVLTTLLTEKNVQNGQTEFFIFQDKVRRRAHPSTRKPRHMLRSRGLPLCLYEE